MSAPGGIPAVAGFDMATATAGDLDGLLSLVAAYHAFEGIGSTASGRAAAVAPLLACPDLGAVWSARSKGRMVGYLAVCLGYSIEFGGRDAFVDELFVTPGSRGLGIATALLREAAGAMRAAGVRALHLEVGRRNEAARRLYARAGFASRDRYHLMTLGLVPITGPTRRSAARRRSYRFRTARRPDHKQTPPPRRHG